MNRQEQLEFIQDNHFSEWLTTRKVVENEMSDRNEMFCVCGKLATGFHESGCKKFHTAVTNETLKRLNHLLENK